jgi:hypothetical protein
LVALSAPGDRSGADDVPIYGVLRDGDPDPGPAVGTGSDTSGAAPSKGAGGGGTGFSIGSGRYGAIGRASRQGSGACCDDLVGGPGGLHSRPSPVAIISLGQPNVTPDDVLDKAIIRRYIKRNVEKLLSCYEGALVHKPKLAGTLTTKFGIDADGHVTSPSASGLDPKLEKCIAQTIQAIQFPKPRDNQTVSVVYALMFRPPGS